MSEQGDKGKLEWPGEGADGAPPSPLAANYRRSSIRKPAAEVQPDPDAPPPDRPLPPGRSWVKAGRRWKEFSGEAKPYLPIDPDVTNAGWVQLYAKAEGVGVNRTEFIPPRTRRLDGARLQVKGLKRGARVGGWAYTCIDCKYRTLNRELMEVHQQKRRSRSVWWHRLVKRLWPDRAPGRVAGSD